MLRLDCKSGLSCQERRLTAGYGGGRISKTKRARETIAIRNSSMTGEDFPQLSDLETSSEMTKQEMLLKPGPTAKYLLL